MKLLVLFTVALIAMCAHYTKAAMDEEQAKDMFRNMAQECKTKEKATDDDIELMLKKEKPASRAGQCMMVCLQTQFGMVIMKDENTGEFSEEGFLKLAKMACEDDAEKYELSKQLAGDCKATTDPDRCELGLKIVECFKNAAIARNATYDGM